MKALKYLPLLLLAVGCVELKTLSLYEQEDLEEAVVGLGDFSQTTMLRDDPGEEVWGIQDGEGCKDIQLSTENPYQGTHCLKMSWDIKGGCEWTGMGFGWSQWQGKDISSILNTGAIEFFARVDEGSYNYMPIVFLMEDYADKQAGAGFNPLCLNGQKITTEWTKVTVPLSSFNFSTGADASNVKQLIIQFMGKGDFYIDHMSIVPYENTKYRKIAADLPVDNTLPQKLFQDNFTHSWGMSDKYCGNYSLVNGQGQDESAGIVVKRGECDWDQFGFSWNGWERTDISGFQDKAALQMMVKSNKTGETSLGAEVVIEDYNGRKSYVDIVAKYAGKSFNGSWQKVVIPLAEFKFGETGVDSKILKQIMFKVKPSADFVLDEIEFVKY